MKVTGLFVYPIKSCAGISLQQATLTSKGLAGDREWMVIQQDGTFVTQRQVSKMALITPHLERGQLRLSAPGVSDIVVQNIAPGALPKTVKVWKDHCHGFVADSSVNQWITDFLQHKSPLLLVKFDNNTARTPYQPERFGHNNAKFSDAAPFLVTNDASLNALNHTTDSPLRPLSMARFRPNIVISGIPPFSEHEISTLDFGSVALTMVDHCSRCAIITIDPVTGKRDPLARPFKSLAMLNSMPNYPKVPAFGVNARLKDKESSSEGEKIKNEKRNSDTSTNSTNSNASSPDVSSTTTNTHTYTLRVGQSFSL